MSFNNKNAIPVVGSMYVSPNGNDVVKSPVIVRVASDDDCDTGISVPRQVNKNTLEEEEDDSVFVVSVSPPTLNSMADSQVVVSTDSSANLTRASSTFKTPYCSRSNSLGSSEKLKKPPTFDELFNKAYEEITLDTQTKTPVPGTGSAHAIRALIKSRTKEKNKVGKEINAESKETISDPISSSLDHKFKNEGLISSTSRNSMGKEKKDVCFFLSILNLCFFS